uniref:hypothetical protein n=1 Tax=uncultured Sphingomonas sp. TaxID=158754 RepID=UPI0025E949F6|nr:hypothetical protein [uncultured Sphingomonas sp.]
MPHPPRTRRDGWTPERQAIFLATLRITRSVSRAAAAAGISRKSAYAFRNRSGGRLFAAGWDRALELSLSGFSQPLREGDKGNGRAAAAPAPREPKVTALPPAKVTRGRPPAQTARQVNPSQAGPPGGAARDASFACLAAARRTA